MREFFVDEVVGIKFELFGLIHLICLSVLFIGLFLIYSNQDKISKISEITAKKIKTGMISIIMINRIIYIGTQMIYGIYTWKEDLPLHFCFITGYLFIYYLITKKEKVFKTVFFFAFMGPFTATIWPDLKSSLDYFVFYEFFISHHLVVLSVFFIYYLDKIKIEKKDIIRTFVFANLIFIFAIIFNKLFQTNYIMSEELPEHILELYPFLNNFNNPIITIIVAGMIAMSLAYIPVYLKNKNN